MLLQTSSQALVLALGLVNAFPAVQKRTNGTFASITQADRDPEARAAAIAVKQAGYLYRPSREDPSTVPILVF